MPIDADALPNDPIVLQEMLRELYAENDKLRLMIQRLTRHQFGRRSELRWTPPVGQSGGLDKLGSGCRQAAKFSIPDAQYASSGERPASIECGRRVL